MEAKKNAVFYRGSYCALYVKCIAIIQTHSLVVVFKQ